MSTKSENKNEDLTRPSRRLFRGCFGDQSCRLLSLSRALQRKIVVGLDICSLLGRYLIDTCMKYSFDGGVFHTLQFHGDNYENLTVVKDSKTAKVGRNAWTAQHTEIVSNP